MTDLLLFSIYKVVCNFLKMFVILLMEKKQATFKAYFQQTQSFHVFYEYIFCRIRNKVKVILGAHEIKNSREITQVEIIGELFITHEKYNSTSFENDIALIKLARPVELNNFIQTVSLLPKANANEDFTNERVTSIGWGLTRDVPNPSIDDISSVLMAANLTVIPLSSCEGFNDNDQHIVYVTKKNICTSGYRAKGTCEGDSGSPLMHDGKQIGLVSIGPSECEACWPSVYTHVGKFLNWIESNSDVVIE